VMPSPSDSSHSLTGRSSRSLTQLRVQRTWLQILLVLGFVQVILGILIITFSLVAATITPSPKVRHSCPSWAGFLDLLLSVCGLTIFSTIVCMLSAVMCCIQIFSLDIIHVLAPQRSRSVTLECTSPPDPFLQSMMDFEEFVPPVPPPPYYPPEYTCSSETDAQSITYNGSMDSPVPLYPTDFPPSYEMVMGLHGDSQVRGLSRGAELLSAYPGPELGSLPFCRGAPTRGSGAPGQNSKWRVRHVLLTGH
uniref:Family with sequence similarity 189 member B n=1 Tax=Pelusios castaneus TaxID=367368 RepID=A0A8C8RKX8_9SAUR